MAQSGYTPIQHYYSSTTTNVPLAANLIAGEIAINTADGKLFYKDSSNVVQVIATTASAISSVNNNGVVYVNSSGQATTGTSFVFTGTNVGIGTSSPNQKLQVNNTAAASSLALFTNATTGSASGDGSYFGIDSSGVAYVWNQENLAVLFGTNNGERMRIDASGNVGIGTNSPSGISTYPTLDIRGSAGGGLRYGSSTVNGYLYADTSGAQLGTVTSSPVIFYTNGTDRMRIDASGNVGIGTNAPNTRLQVYKAATSTFTGTSPGALLLTDSSNTLNYFTSIDFNTTNGPSVPYARIGMSYTGGGSTLSFGTSNSYASGITNTALTIDPTGVVIVGGTSTYGARLGVIGTASGTNSYIQITNPGVGTGTLGVATGSTNFKIYNSYATGVLTSGVGIDIDTSGNVLVGLAAPSLGGLFEVNGIVAGYSLLRFPYIGSSTGTAVIIDGGGYLRALTSSRRYKENIEPIDVGLDLVMQMQPVKYNLKEGGAAQIGFIAEDFPEARLVNYSMVDLKNTEKGEQIESVNYNNLTAILVKAIQEQQALITQLTDRIAALETK